MIASFIPIEQCFNETLAWLESHYWDQPFYVERDIVWTIQLKLARRIKEAGAHYRVFNDYPMIPGPRRSLSADIAVVDNSGIVELAVEFKFEPSHRRTDISPGKFPVVFWGIDGVAKDILRIREFVELRKAKVAIALFIDEGGYFARRPPHPESEWRTWAQDAFLLYARADIADT
jgi:hypothetical protein